MKKETLINIALTLLISIVVFIQNKYFIKYMGIETLGVMKLFNQLLQYLNIAELGVGSVLTFALYKPLVEKNYNEVSSILFTITKIYNKIAIGIFSLGIVAFPVISFLVSKNNFNYHNYLYWCLYLVNTALSYSFIKYIILFTANGEFILTRYIQVGSKLFFQVLQIYIIIKYHLFILFILLLIFDTFTQYILFKKYFKKKYNYIKKTQKKYKGVFNNIKILFWHKISSLVVFNTDLILISKLVSLESVGIYSNYQLIFGSLQVFLNSILGVITPRIGAFIAKNTKKQIYFLFRKLNIVFLMISLLLTTCSFYLINHFIILWIGKEYLLNFPITVVIALNFFVLLFRKILDIFKECFGFFDDIQIPILESLINLLTSIFLGIKYGVLGIVLGTLISNIIIILIYRPILVFKRCFNKTSKEYIKVYSEYLCIFIISNIMIYFLNQYINIKIIENWFSWILNGVILGIISIFCIVTITFILSKDFRELVKICSTSYKKKSVL